MGKTTGGWRGILNLLAFVAILSIGVALLIGFIFPSLAHSFTLVAEVIAYAITGTLAFYFVKGRHWAYTVIWIVCLVLIIVLKFL